MKDKSLIRNNYWKNFKEIIGRQNVLKKYKNELFISIGLFLISSSLLLFYFHTNSQKNILMFKKNTLGENALLINTAINDINRECDAIFYIKINQPSVLKIINDANNPVKRDTARKRLYSLLLPTYKVLKKDNIKLFFFHLPGAISFLRFHEPNIYGDSIKNVRYSVDLVNQTKKIIRGFEEGKIVSDFRNVYPLFYKNRFVGSVDLSYSIKAIAQRLYNKGDVFYGLLVKKHLIQKKVWKQFYKNYIQSLIDNNYVWDRRVFNAKFYKLSEREIIDNLRLIEKELNVKGQLSKHKAFVGFASLKGKNFIAIFQSVKNIKNQPVAYIVTIKENNFLAMNKIQTRQIEIIIVISTLSTSLLLFLFLKREKDTKEALSIKANYDPLTNLLNRRGFEIAYQTLLDIQTREPRSFAILYLDIDHFKKINDTYGHDKGDEVLKKLAELLRANLRKSDIIARWGGEEFITLVNNVDVQIAEKIAQKIRKNVEKYNNSKLPRFTVSIGVAHSKGNEDLDIVIKKADEALYFAKKSGRNRVVVLN